MWVFAVHKNEMIRIRYVLARCVTNLFTLSNLLVKAKVERMRKYIDTLKGLITNCYRSVMVEIPSVSHSKIIYDTHSPSGIDVWHENL